MYYLGIDLGSSFIKIALVDINSGQKIGLIQEPEKEMPIEVLKPGWAEQDPEVWWDLVCKGIRKIIGINHIHKSDILGIGIAYQMHGLVMIDKGGKPLRNAIIWCDSRAVEIGNEAYQNLGPDWCTSQLLNSPGNFTASKLNWVKRNEPGNFERIFKVMLPGDYIAYRLTGTINTTVSGLSEGIFWNYKDKDLSQDLLEYYGISNDMIPDVVETFGNQGAISKKGSMESGLLEGTPLLYRSGDQPNNALSLNVFEPGEIAATGGTSGVVYAISDNPSVREPLRINNFAHVNYSKTHNRIGKLLCINGAGIQYRWLLNNLDVSSYAKMNELASQIDVGSEGLCVIPFGNGAERILKNSNLGTRILNLNLNRHNKSHMCRSALEGIAFSFVYGMEIMASDGVKAKVIRAGNDNLFRSGIFASTIATLLNIEIEIYATTGAIGAARACAISDFGYSKFTLFTKKDYVKTYSPLKVSSAYTESYQNWTKELNNCLKSA